MREVLNSRIFKIIYTVFVILFSLIMALYLLMTALEGKDLFGYSIYKMPDNSMKGSYNKNDILLTKKIDNNILETGNDIVYYGTSFGLEGRLIIHRLVSVDNSNKKDIKFVTQSLSSSLPDPAIHKSDILGIVIGRVSFLTELNQIINNQIGFLLIIFFPVVIILIIEIIKTSIALKLEKNKYSILKDKDRGKHEKKDKE